MSSDTWNQLQAHKRKQESLKERLLKRRKERQGLLEGEVANVLSTESSGAAPSSLKNDEGNCILHSGRLILFYGIERYLSYRS